MGGNQGRKGDFVFVNGPKQFLGIKADHVVDKHRRRYHSIGKGIKYGIDMAHGHDQHHLISRPDALVDIVQIILCHCTFMCSHDVYMMVQISAESTMISGSSGEDLESQSSKSIYPSGTGPSPI